jgi:nucleoside-diphosphate-sugar epimerase
MMPAPMKVERIPEPILVTGATGFIGRALMARLLDGGYQPQAFVLPGDPVPIEWGDRVRIHLGDISHRSAVGQAVKGAATVFHLAAMVGDWGRPAAHQRVTVRGTENVLSDASRQGARCILASSIVVYGDRLGSDVCDEDHAFGRALGPYSKSKQEQERIAARLEELCSLRVTIVRPANVYGPGSVPWVDKVAEVLQAGQPALIGHGRLDAGLTYVDNVVDVLVRVAERPATVGRTYNASDDNGVTWLRYFTELAELLHAPPPKRVPRRLAAIAAAGMDGAWKLLRRADRPPLTRESLNLVGSHHRIPIDKARLELDYEPPVSYQDGMLAVGHYLNARHPRGASA